MVVLEEKAKESIGLNVEEIPFFRLEQIVEEYKYLTVEPRDSSIDYALDKLFEGVKLFSQLDEALKKEKEKLEKRKKKETFTIDELENIKRKEKRLQDWEMLIGELRLYVKGMEEKILNVIPKINKEKFKLKTDKYILQIEEWNITRIDCLKQRRVTDGR